jgi:hypothetical protein
MQTLMNTKRELTRMQYEIIDNFLPQEEFEKIRDVMMSADFPWFYNPCVTHSNKLVDSALYFTHNFYRDSCINSSFFELLLPLTSKLNVKAMIRIKGNLYPNIGKTMENLRHTDYKFEHKGAIYYINTNNGPTVLEDGTKIDAVENRILFFDSSKKHNSTYCTDQKVRVNININYF